MVALSLALVLASLPNSLSASPRSDDNPSSTWTSTSTMPVSAYEVNVQASVAGDALVLLGTSHWSFTGGGGYLFVRVLERTTGLERWTYWTPEGLSVQGMAVDQVNGRVHVLYRGEPDAQLDVDEHFVSLDLQSGAEVLAASTTITPGSPGYTSVDTSFEGSPSGDLVVRTDFFQQIPATLMRTRAYDTATGALLWSDVRPASPASIVDGSRSTVFSPNGQTVYVGAAVHPLGTTASAAYLIAFEGSSGAEEWSLTFGDGNPSESLLDVEVSSAGQELYLLKGAVSDRSLLRIDTAGGTVDWEVPCAPGSQTIALAPNGTQLCVGAYDYIARSILLERRRTTNGSPTWSMVVPTVQDDVSLDELEFTPNSAHIVFASRFLIPVSPPAYGSVIGCVDASNAMLPWIESSTTSHTIEWLDLVATSPSTSLVAVGRRAGVWETGFQTIRDAYETLGGGLLWSHTQNDTLPMQNGSAFRVWVDTARRYVTSWMDQVSAGTSPRFRLERRDFTSGILLDAFDLDYTSQQPIDMLPELSDDHRYVAIGNSPLRVFDVETGAIVFSGVNSSGPIHSRFVPGSTRLYFTSETVTSPYGVNLGAVDTALGQTVWQKLMVPTPTFKVVRAEGLDVDVASGDVYFAFTQKHPLGNVELVVTRRAADTGDAAWTTALPVFATFHRRDHHNRSHPSDTTIRGSTLTVLRASPDGSRLYVVETKGSGASTVSRIASLDAITGAFLWVASTGDTPGHDGRTIDMAVSTDRRFVHVLSEGRGPVATEPRRVIVATFDGNSGALLWKDCVSDLVGHARRIESVGSGNRVVVLGTADTDAKPATGGTLVALDAQSGVELWRHTESGIRSDVCDMVIVDDRSIVLAGAKWSQFENTEAFIERLEMQYLIQGPDAASLSAGGHTEYHFDFDVARAGDIHALVGTLSGTSPGLSLANGFNLPLNYDAYTDLSPLFVNSIGVLDAAGDGKSRLFVPPGSFGGFAGLPFSFAALAIDPATGVSATSNPVFLTMLP